MEGKRAQPLEWLISRVCEDFHTDPTHALRILGYAPSCLDGEILHRIYEYRSYAQVHDAYKAIEETGDKGNERITKLKTHSGWKLYESVALSREGRRAISE